MSRQLTGHLPYGSADETVLLNIALTSAAELDALVTAGSLVSWTLLGTGATFSADGFSGNGTGGLQITLSDTLANQLNSVAEISFDVESAYITQNDSTTAKSYGNMVVSGQEYICTGYPSAYSSACVLAYASNNTIDSFASSSAQYEYTDQNRADVLSTNNTWRPHSEVFTDTYTRMSADIKPGNFSIALGGLHATWCKRNQVDKQFKILVFGTDRGVGSHFRGKIKNVLIAARDVVIPTLPVLRKAVIVGDSLVDLDNMTNGFRVAAPSFAIRKAFESTGVKFGDLYCNENAGYRVSQLSSVVNTEITNNVSVLFYRGLTNDIQPAAHPSYAGANPSWSYLIDNANPLLTTTGADLLNQMERALGVNGNPKTSIEKVVLGNVPIKPGEAGSASYVTAANAIVDAVVDHIKTTYGENLIAKADVFGVTKGTSGTSGSNPLTDVFSDGTHLWPRYCYKMGLEYARALKSIMKN